MQVLLKLRNDNSDFFNGLNFIERLTYESFEISRVTISFMHLTFLNFCFAYFNNYINLSKLCNFVAFSDAETFH